MLFEVLECLRKLRLEVGDRLIIGINFSHEVGHVIFQALLQLVVWDLVTEGLSQTSVRQFQLGMFALALPCVLGTAVVAVVGIAG